MCHDVFSYILQNLSLSIIHLETLSTYRY